MKTQKWMMPLGMIAVLSFLALAISGRLLWAGYDPVSSYISQLLADEAPHVHLMRTFMNIYTICFCLFTFGVSVHAFRSYHLCAKIGYATFCSFFPISVGIWKRSNQHGVYSERKRHLSSYHDHLYFVHYNTAMILITVGYLRQEYLNTMGKISLFTGILFILFNVWHVAAILSGQNILGLIQKLTFYSFHAFTFSMSWIYTFKESR